LNPGNGKPEDEPGTPPPGDGKPGSPPAGNSGPPAGSGVIDKNGTGNNDAPWPDVDCGAAPRPELCCRAEELPAKPPAGEPLASLVEAAGDPPEADGPAPADKPEAALPAAVA
jgi:hypothetical protein